MREGRNKKALEIEVRERRIGPNGEPNGSTSWVVSVGAERVREVLAAADAGIVLTAESPAHGVGAAIEAALAAALARPTLDTDAVRAIALEVAREHAMQAGVTRIIVDNPREVNVDVGTQHPHFARALALVSVGIPVLITGPKGSGKSEAAKAIALALSLPFVADSFSADSGRHDVFGFVDANGRYVSTAFRPAFRDGWLYCGDEVDNGTSNLGAAFNLALSNGHANFPDEASVPRHENFRFIATSNTMHGARLTFSGREAIDGALLDRMAVVDWPIDEAFETRLALAHNPKASDWIECVQRVRKAMDEAGLDRFSPSPRASINGARMLASGMSVSDCREVFLYRGADADTRARIRSAF